VKPVCKYSSVAFMGASATHSSNSDRAQKSARFDLLHSRRIKKCLKSTSAIKVATMKNTDNFSLCEGSHHMQPPNLCFSLSAKMNGTQRGHW